MGLPGIETVGYGFAMIRVRFLTPVRDGLPRRWQHGLPCERNDISGEAALPGFCCKVAGFSAEGGYVVAVVVRRQVARSLVSPGIFVDDPSARRYSLEIVHWSRYDVSPPATFAE